VLGGIYAVLVFAEPDRHGGGRHRRGGADGAQGRGALGRSRAPTLFALLIGALLYTPVAMMFWFAPLLPPGTRCRRSRRCSSAGPPAGATAARSSPTPCCSRCCWWRCRWSWRRCSRLGANRAVVPGDAVLAADAGDPVLLVLRDLPRLLQHRAAGETATIAWRSPDFPFSPLPCGSGSPQSIGPASPPTAPATWRRGA
jgi:hypothetical protein